MSHLISIQTGLQILTYLEKALKKIFLMDNTDMKDDSNFEDQYDEDYFNFIEEDFTFTADDCPCPCDDYGEFPIPSLCKYGGL